jgi:prepilin-type N-terminal cleavage/methylation domain-containing protein
MRRKRGFTLAELLITMIISAVLILMVGFLSQIAFSSHEQIKNEADVYSDLFYGLSRISFLARKAIKLEPGAPSAAGTSNMLFVDYKDLVNCPPPLNVCKCAFGLYLEGGNMKLVFIPDRTAPTVTETILENIDTASSPSFTVTPNGSKSVIINFQGKKLTQSNKLESFVISNFVVTRRN